MIIWANHNLRAAITAMRETSHRIMQDQSLAGIEGAIASVRDVFRLVGQGELAEAEARYLAPRGRELRAVVLAASRGEALGPLTERLPKSMIDVRGQPLLRRLVSTLNDGGIRDVTVVRGYKRETIDLANVATVDNDAYAETGEAASLACAREQLDGPCLISYGDILFRPYILENLLAAKGDIVTVVDARWQGAGHRAPDRQIDAVRCSRPFTGDYLDEEPVWVTAIGDNVLLDDAQGEFIGLTRLSEQGAHLVRQEIAAMEAEGALATADLPTLLARLLDKGVRIGVLYITGHWLDVDDAFDLAKARNLI
jgi:phosphoenolpyruvate phosphomutase